ncbi:NAD(P)-binding domain-containing protein [Phenylobacterium sp.]|uniref:NAD(P)-binding domain-containing protein n=1 Tax=Phenylobacterium sp. TaxID=1871053 RepID=UPI0025D7CECB|nr:NAD(P)-binding domain-containing protein [Phenylobacterium sp.]
MGASISTNTDVAIVGAGPYGLSIAAHLRARGVDHRIFGSPLSTWRERMPPGMVLKSDGFASSLSAPGRGFTLREYCAQNGVHYHPTGLAVALETFVDYGLAFQRQEVAQLEPQQVVALAPAAGGWRIELDNGGVVTARRVVLAVGITHFARTPEAFAGLSADQVSHSSDHRDFSRFAGAEVTVIGAGSSAVDVALGLAAAGAKTRLVARREALKFARPRDTETRSLWSRIRHPSSGLGNGLRSRLACDAPDLFRALPREARLAIVRRHLGPSSLAEQKAKVEAGVEVLTGRRIATLSGAGGRVRLGLASADGTPAQVAADHVICATGYEADVQRLSFLEAGVRDGLRTAGKAPALSGGFESSAPGLYFVGIAAAATFGPLMRFMFGDEFAARRVSAHLQRQAL